MAKHEIDFGSYVMIEQKRYGCENKMFQYKVIGRLHSNGYVDVPVECGSNPHGKETLHDETEDVVRAVCCGVCETNVRKFRVEDVILCET